MKRIFLLFPMVIFMFSCSKNKSAVNAEILKKHQWYAYQKHTVEMGNDGHIISDNTSFTNSCTLNSIFLLQDNDKALLYGNCLSDTVYGDWNFNPATDSLFVRICVAVPQTGGAMSSIFCGANMVFAGIEPAPIIEIDETHFVVQKTNLLYNGSTGESSKFINMTTYKSL